MNNQQKLLAGIFAITFFLSVTFQYLFVDNGGWFWMDWFIILRPIFFVVPAFLVGLMITDFFNKKGTNRMKVFIWTNFIAVMLFGLLIFAGLSFGWHKKMIDEVNGTYKNFYGDSRDKYVRLAINSNEQKQPNKSDYKIFEMGVTERDTILSGQRMKYFIINQIFYNTYKFDRSHAYVSRHLVYENEEVEEVNYSKLLDDHSGQWEKHEKFMEEVEQNINVTTDSNESLRDVKKYLKTQR